MRQIFRFASLLTPLVLLTACAPYADNEYRTPNVERKVIVYRCDNNGDATVYTLILARKAFSSISESAEICLNKLEHIQTCEQYKKYATKCIRILKSQSDIFIHEIDSTMLAKPQVSRLIKTAIILKSRTLASKTKRKIPKKACENQIMEITE